MVAVILAAGEGTRMKSDLPKVLLKVGGRPMLGHVLETVLSLGINEIIVVTGYKSEMVREYVGPRAKTVLQEKPSGTADAVLRAKSRKETLEKLLTRHSESGASCSLLTVILKDPTGYGRIVRSDKGSITRIVEEKDASIYEKVIEEINVGVYCFKSKDLFDSIDKICSEKKQGEYYLTDVIEILSKKNLKMESVSTDDQTEVLGVNSPQDMAFAQRIIKDRVFDRLVNHGVAVMDRDTTYIELDAKIGRGTTVFPFVFIESGSSIGENCQISPFSHIKSGTVVKDNTILRSKNIQ
ncbi:MAG: NTP transferase domain-containing protein [Candidatus Omnitrophica bacterium]|nr:NTP transferase domain-containing protein [Candidatus Omnitrophota bacterium]